jgi:catechol-2,3-dioxygenase
MSDTPQLDRVLETCLYVDDLERAAGFYERVLGLEPLTADARFRAYDVGGQSVLLLFRRGADADRSYLAGLFRRMMHMAPPDLAFAIAPKPAAMGGSGLSEHDVAIKGRTYWLAAIAFISRP